jgi:hypothetical protein
MSSEIKADKWSPASGTSATIGDSGDTYTVPSGVTLNTSSATLTLPSTVITGQTAKTSLVDADKFLISDSAASGALKYVESQYIGGGAMTLLEQKIGTSNVSNLVFENKFSNTYTRYIIYIDYMYNGTTNTHLRYKFRKSDGSGGYEDETRVGYTYTIAGRRSGADEFNSESSGGATDFGRLTPMITRSGGEHGLKAVLEVYRPGTVDSQACMTYVQGRGMYRSYINDSSMAAHFNSSSNNYHTDAFLGIKLYFSSGDVDDYKVTLYGVTT